MRNWSTAFKSYKNSGVYAIKAGKELTGIEQSARDHNLTYLYIDLSGVPDKAALLQTIASVFQFPAYFGMNWDALEECITDLAWLKAKGYILVFDNIDTFATNNPKESQIAHTLLRTAAAFWKNQRTPFYVFLVKTAKL